MANTNLVFDFSSILDDDEEVDYEDTSVARQMGYGFEQEPHLLGTAYRGLWAVARSAFSDQTVGEAFREEEEERQKEIDEDFPEFIGLKEEDETSAMLAGRVGSGFTDLAGWLIPWARVAKYGKAAVVGAGAAFAGTESAARDYALYGKVEAQTVLLNAVIGGTVAVGAEAAQSSISKFIANRKKNNQPTEIVEEIAEDLADPVKVLPTPLAPMRDVIKEWRRGLNDAARKGSGEILLTNKSSQADWVRAANRVSLGRPQSMAVRLTEKEADALEVSTSRIVKDSKVSEDDIINTTFIAKQSKIIEELRASLIELKKAAKKAKKAKDEEALLDINRQIESLTKQSRAAREQLSQHTIKLSQQRANLNVDVLEDMAKQGTLTSRIMQKVLKETARPIGFGVAGGVFGLSNMDKDDDWGHIMSYVGVGASLGVLHKRIQRSDTFTDINKATGEQAIRNAGEGFLGNAASHLKWITGGSTAARMDAMGGWVKVIGNRLFSKLGSNVEGVEARTQRIQSEYLEKLFQITSAPAERSFVTRGRRAFGTDVTYDVIDSKNNAINTVVGEVMRGYKKVGDLTVGYKGLKNDLAELDADDIAEIRSMVPRLEKLRDDIARRMEEVGIKFKYEEHYGLQQVWDKAGIDDNYSKFIKDFEEALYIQTKNKYMNAGNDPSTIKMDTIKKDARKYADKISGRHIDVDQARYEGSALPPIFVRGTDNKYKFRTAAKAFENRRSLTDVEATQFMYEKGYLNLHAGDSLASYGTSAIKAAEFAEAFGANGEVINIALQNLRKSFEAAKEANPNNSDFLVKMQQTYEEQLIGSIEAYWGGYGRSKKFAGGYGDTAIKAFTTLANVTYLTTVSIANLGDLVQPFTNSSYGAAVKALTQRVGKNKLQFSEMSSFKYDKAYERDLSSFMRKSSTGSFNARLDNLNDFYFFGVGLSKVTKMSRNFAYDVGVNRAFKLAKKQKLNKQELDELAELKLTSQDLKAIGKFDTVEEAFERQNARSFLDRAGRSSTDRDAIIPSVGNRLLFTQTNNNAIRSIGQFMSWAQAKTSQTNRLLERVENGNARLAIKILAATPVYAGFLELKRSLNPNMVRDDDETLWEADGTELLNYVGDAMKLSGSFDNAILEKTLGGVKSMWYGAGIGEAFIPSLGLTGGFLKGAYRSGTDLAEGESLNALKRIAVGVPPVSQISGYVEKATGEPLIDLKRKSKKKKRIYNKGGEVLNVPNVPTEPDERIDKLTGRPYNEQAGEAFIDNDDDPFKRMGFGRGGNVEEVDPLQRMGFGTGSMVTATTKEERAEDMSMYRADGSKKSNKGFIGQVKNNVSGGIMTEVSVGVEIQGEEVSIPTMVPTLTTKEIEILSNMKIKGNAKSIPKSIINKAIKHAEKRKAEGKSPFYQDGEDRVIKNKGGKVLSSLQRKH